MAEITCYLIKVRKLVKKENDRYFLYVKQKWVPDTKHELLEEFIQLFGYGPFLDIHSLDITGKYVEESIPKRRVK